MRRPLWIAAWMSALLAFGCSSSSHEHGTHASAEHPNAEPDQGDDAPVEEADPERARSLDEIPFPPYPEAMTDATSRCASDYRDIAATPLPARDESQPFNVWFAGPFQGWVDHYNAVRERCDEVFATLDAEGPEAQVLLATQSYMHQRMGQEAVPLETEPEMFVMSRYWTLGASCTYQHCLDGPLEPWTELCRTRGRMLPACPAAPPSEGGETEPAADSAPENDSAEGPSEGTEAGPTEEPAPTREG